MDYVSQLIQKCQVTGIRVEHKLWNNNSKRLCLSLNVNENEKLMLEFILEWIWIFSFFRSPSLFVQKHFRFTWIHIGFNLFQENRSFTKSSDSRFKIIPRSVKHYNGAFIPNFIRYHWTTQAIIVNNDCLISFRFSLSYSTLQCSTLQSTIQNVRYSNRVNKISVFYLNGD